MLQCCYIILFAKDFLPNIVFIKLGTNDIHPRYAETEEMFLTAYQQIADLFPDKLHPNPEGERIIAETIFGYLK